MILQPPQRHKMQRICPVFEKNLPRFSKGEEVLCKTLHSPYNGGTAQAFKTGELQLEYVWHFCCTWQVVCSRDSLPPSQCKFNLNKNLVFTFICETIPALTAVDVGPTCQIYESESLVGPCFPSQGPTDDMFIQPRE